MAAPNMASKVVIECFLLFLGTRQMQKGDDECGDPVMPRKWKSRSRMVSLKLDVRNSMSERGSDAWHKVVQDWLGSCRWQTVSTGVGPVRLIPTTSLE
jgi:hypothetical protein